MELISRLEYPRQNPFRVFDAYYSLNGPIINRLITNSDYLYSKVHFNGKTIVGEDPRPFRWNGGQRYFLAQDCSQSIQCSKQNIVNYDTGEVICVRIGDDFIYGKNWSPYVIGDELYFIHSFDPLTIIKMEGGGRGEAKVVCKIPMNLPSSGMEFGMFRGGTNGLHLPERKMVIGIGHATVYPIDHRPTFWVLDMETNTFATARIGADTYTNELSLADPTSLWMEEGGDVYAAVWESSHDWYTTNCLCVSRIFKLDIDTMLKRMPSWEFYTVVDVTSLRQ